MLQARRPAGFQYGLRVSTFPAYGFRLRVSMSDQVAEKHILLLRRTRR